MGVFYGPESGKSYHYLIAVASAVRIWEAP